MTCPICLPFDELAAEMVRKGVAPDTETAIHWLESVLHQVEELKFVLDLKISRHAERCTADAEGRPCHYPGVLAAALVAMGETLGRGCLSEDGLAIARRIGGEVYDGAVTLREARAASAYRAAKEPA